nr:ABC transporter G family member 39-like [Arachis hypogaea]
MLQKMKEQGVQEDKLMLLKGVSGAFRPGVLTALMGVSGAGKTTLMDVLAGRKTSGYIEGSIKVSRYPKKQETFARVSDYCEQNDMHSPHVTVYESLLYSAWLRLSSSVDSKTRKMFIEEVMELVELTPLRKTGVVVFITEGDPHPGAARGRMSFQSFNPSVDNLNEEEAKLQQPVAETNISRRGVLGALR